MRPEQPALPVPTAQKPVAKSLPHPPGPRGDTLLGSTLDFKESPLQFICYVQKAYGDVARFRVGPSHWVLVSDPKLVWEMMVERASEFRKPAVARRLWEKFLGDGLLTTEGEVWRRQNRLIRPAFKKGRINAYGETMVAYTERMMADWTDGQELDLGEALVALTLEVVAKTLFDADVREGSARVGEAMKVLNVEMLNHIYMPVPLPRWWPSKANRRKIKAIDDIEAIVRDVIEERRSGGEDKGDLLSMLVFSTDDTGDRLTDKEIRDQAMTLFFAGHETTAHALTWSWYLLARYPEVTRRLQADIDAVAGDNALTVAMLKELPYLSQVVDECLRILPSVWVFMKEPIETTHLGDYRIDKGTQIMISPYVLQHDARWFPSPETFDPDRFSKERAKSLPKGAYVPFSGGSRICAGRNFALMEMRLILGTMLQRLVPEVPEDHVPTKEAVLSMQPKDGLPATVRFRKR